MGFLEPLGYIIGIFLFALTTLVAFAFGLITAIIWGMVFTVLLILALRRIHKHSVVGEAADDKRFPNGKLNSELLDRYVSNMKEKDDGR